MTSSAVSFIRESLPEPLNTDLDDFQKILLLKCLRSDKVTNNMQDFVSSRLGQRFIEPQVIIIRNLQLLGSMCAS